VSGTGLVRGIAGGATADAAAVTERLLWLDVLLLLLTDPRWPTRSVSEVSAALRRSCQAQQQAIQLGNRPGIRLRRE